MAFYAIQIDGEKYLAHDEKLKNAVDDKAWARTWSTKSGAEKAVGRLAGKLKGSKLKAVRV